MATSNQVNLRLPDDLVERVDAAASRFNMSRAQIFLELAQFYFDLWEQAEAAKQRVIDEQRAHLRQPAGTGTEK